MDHHEQHHEHHKKAREQRLEQRKLRQRKGEKVPGKIHPAWFLVLGVVLIALVVLTWVLSVP